MPEIERKFLLREQGVLYTTPAFSEFYSSVDHLVEEVGQAGITIKQGYLPIHEGIILAKLVQLSYAFNPEEVRIRDKGGSYFITVKGSGDLVRNEEEAQISGSQFHEWWQRTMGKQVYKMRLAKPFRGLTVEFDVYSDRDLVVAEVEFPSVTVADMFNPLGKDVTNNKQYKNKNLAK